MAREKQQTTSPEPWVLGAVLGLGEDGGWVDALKRELASRPTEVGPCWEELLHLARGARPRGGGEWAEIQQKSETQCGYPPALARPSEWAT